MEGESAFKGVMMNEFKKVNSMDPVTHVTVTDETGEAMIISKEDLKAFLGTVQAIAPKALAPTDPAPTLDGVFIPTVTQSESGAPVTYTNAGGLSVNTSIGGEDFAKMVQFVKNGPTFIKVAIPLPQAENRIVPLNPTLTYTAGKQFIYQNKIFEVSGGQTFNAGEAVEGSTKLIERLGSSLDKKLAAFKAGGYFTTSGTTLGAFTSSASYVYAIEPVTEGETWYIKGVGGAGPRLWAFVAEDGTILTKAVANLNPGASYVKVTAPKGAKNLYINSTTVGYGAYRDSLLPDIYKSSRDISAMLSAKKSTSADTEKGFYYPTNSATVGAKVAQAGYENIIFDVKKGDAFSIKGLGGTNPRLFAIADADGNILRSATAAENSGASYTVEQDAAAKVYINNDVTVPLEILFYTTDFPKSVKAAARSRNVLYMAAADSDPMDKLNADIVCTGVNDEKTFERAFGLLPKGGKIYLYMGIYNVDYIYSQADGGTRTAIFVADSGFNRMIEIIGIVKPQFFYGKNAAIIKLTQAGYDTLDPNLPVSIIRGDQKALGHNSMKPSSVILKDVIFQIPSNQKPIRVVDGRFFTTGGMEGVLIYPEDVWNNVYNGTGRPPIPHTGSVGWYGFGTMNSAYYTKLSSCIVYGFHEGFKIGGDHLLLERCAALRNTYGFSFGTHRYTAHDVTLLKCIDETNSNMPLFGDNISGSGGVTFIDFTVERLAGRAPEDGSPFAVETTPGTWHGQIEWSMVNGHNKRFWANDGSGKSVRTINKMQSRGGTTEQRLSYAPNIYQEYYDSDLNKDLVYDGVVWRDKMGNIV